MLLLYVNDFNPSLYWEDLELFLEISTLYDQHFIFSWLALLRVNVKHQLWLQYLLEQGNLSLGIWEHFELNHKLQNLTLHFEGFSKFHLLNWKGNQNNLRAYGRKGGPQLGQQVCFSLHACYLIHSCLTKNNIKCALSNKNKINRRSIW